MAVSNLLSLRAHYFSAALLHRGDKSLLVFLQFADKRLIVRFLVPGGPENHFGEDRSKVDAFGGEQVCEFASVGGIFLRGDDAMSDEFLKAIGEDICGDAFVGVEKFLVAAKSAKHHVAQDEERPAIAQHFHRRVKRASGAALRGWLSGRHRIS